MLGDTIFDDPAFAAEYAEGAILVARPDTALPADADEGLSDDALQALYLLTSHIDVLTTEVRILRLEVAAWRAQQAVPWWTRLWQTVRGWFS